MPFLPAGILEQVVKSSFIDEVNSLKPGNVSRYSPGHGMTAEDFVKSAEVSTPILCDASLSVGRRILKSVEATAEAVGSNTNLGMLLLFAPLIRAAELGADLHINLELVIDSLGPADTDLVFKAIRHARPAGLGDSEKYDVRADIDGTVTLKQVMVVAQDRDSVARQYATNFTGIFSDGLAYMRAFTERWGDIKWAVTGCYMEFLAAVADSHIIRKFGLPVAEQIRGEAIPVANILQKKDNPEHAFPMLMEFDEELKQKGINPGTSADLAAASLLVFRLLATAQGSGYK